MPKKKSKLKWTKEPPTVDGFYWWRSDLFDDELHRVVFEDGFVSSNSMGDGELEDWGGQWYGPIPSEEPN